MQLTANSQRDDDIQIVVVCTLPGFVIDVLVLRLEVELYLVGCASFRCCSCYGKTVCLRLCVSLSFHHSLSVFRCVWLLFVERSLR